MIKKKEIYILLKQAIVTCQKRIKALSSSHIDVDSFANIVIVFF